MWQCALTAAFDDLGDKARLTPGLFNGQSGDFKIFPPLLADVAEKENVRGTVLQVHDTVAPIPLVHVIFTCTSTTTIITTSSTAATNTHFVGHYTVFSPQKLADEQLADLLALVDEVASFQDVFSHLYSDVVPPCTRGGGYPVRGERFLSEATLQHDVGQQGAGLGVGVPRAARGGSRTDRTHPGERADERSGQPWPQPQLATGEEVSSIPPHTGNGPATPFGRSAIRRKSGV